MKLDLDMCRQLDARDELAYLRSLFYLPAGKINMDGNSLGALPKATIKAVQKVMQEEWGRDLIASWSQAGWFDAPERIGAKIAPLLGAKATEVLVADTTSVNIFKCLSAALSLQPDRTVILSERGNFPTDLYMMEGLVAFSEGRYQMRVVAPEMVLDELNSDVAVLLLTHVHYKTAAIKDMKRITQLAHDRGVLVVWDLSHSVGSVELALSAYEVDFAVGCGYKFLNGGPGAPGFLYVAERHQTAAQPVLSGWMGHRDPFAFTDAYEPAEGMTRFRCGTPGILGMTALECGVDVFQQTHLAALRQKAVQLSQLLIDLMEQECANHNFELASPRDARKRGGHVAFRHPEGHGIYQALKTRGVISDFRTPDVLRFGITPLYLRFEDVFQLVQHIKWVMETRAWDQPSYRKRAAIT